MDRWQLFGKGGWAFIATDGKNVAERSGATPNTTNNQMELTAVIRALAATRHHNEIEIHTDSQYVKNGMQVWVPQWKNNNWKTAAKKPVKNKRKSPLKTKNCGNNWTNWHNPAKFIGCGYAATTAMNITNAVMNWHAQRPKR